MRAVEEEAHFVLRVYLNPLMLPQTVAIHGSVQNSKATTLLQMLKLCLFYWRVGFIC